MKPSIIEEKGNNTDSAVGGAFEGASRTSREIALWSPPVRSADADINPNKQLLDSRSRDRMANDGYVANAVHTHQDSIVGGQYMLNCKPAIEILQAQNPAFDEQWMDEFQRVVESRFTLYAESTEAWLDASRNDTFTGLVRLAVGVETFSGEVLATAEWLRNTGRPYNTAIQMVDVDRLSNPYDSFDTDKMRRGIERDRYGAPIAYHIRTTHPGDWYLGQGNGFEWRRVMARKPWGRRQVIHLHQKGRPDQSRGISDMVSVLKQMKMTSKFQDVALQSAVIQATYAATIESELPSDAVYSQMGEGNSTPWAEKYLENIAKYVGSARNLNIDGAKIPHLYPGTKLNIRSAAPNEGVGDNFEQSMLRHIASALGLSYEEFSRDFSQTNYSSGKMAINGTNKRMQAKKKMVADRFANMTFQLWFEEALNKGDIPLPAGVGSEIFYEGQNKEALTQASWIGANKGQIDELKETQAAIMRIKSGLSTYEDECSKLGRDYRDIMKQRAREDRMVDEYGLNYNTDAKAPSPARMANDGGGDDAEDNE